MIPRIINYCWFGNKPLPESALNCIDSWKKYCPDYEIKEWNERNFDINECAYIREAAQKKKWAFVSDYARFKILYEYGGLYFDTDVELLKPIEDIVKKGPFFGCEPMIKGIYSKEIEELDLQELINPGLGMGAEPGMDVYKDVIDYYNKQHFIMPDGSINTETIVTRVTKVLKDAGFNGGKEDINKFAGIYIYPSDYFCPKNYITGEMCITDNTRSIHHYTASWQGKYSKAKSLIQKILGYRITKFIIGIKKRIKGK